MVPVHIELAVARLKWIQSMVAEADNHHIALTMLFGEFKFERVRERENPLKLQWERDLETLRVFDEGYSIEGDWARRGAREDANSADGANEPVPMV